MEFNKGDIVQHKKDLSLYEVKGEFTVYPSITVELIDKNGLVEFERRENLILVKSHQYRFSCGEEVVINPLCKAGNFYNNVYFSEDNKFTGKRKISNINPYSCNSVYIKNTDGTEIEYSPQMLLPYAHLTEVKETVYLKNHKYMVHPQREGEILLVEIAKSNEVKRTERGWAGHFIGYQKCQFRRNTLLEYEDKAWVVSTIGDYISNGKMETVSLDTYYETRVFEVNPESPYLDADTTKDITIGKWGLCAKDHNELTEKYPHPDIEANNMHERVVYEMMERIKD